MQKNAKQEKKKKLTSLNSYAYDCPISVCQPFKEDDHGINTYYYIIENTTKKNYFALFTSLPLSDLPNFKLVLAKRGGEWEANENYFNTWRDMRATIDLNLPKNRMRYQEIYSELFIDQHVTVHYKGPKTIEKKLFENYFKFYVKFFGDVYDVLRNRIASTFLSLNEKPEGDDMNKRTYLVLPATADHEINKGLMNEFMRHLKEVESESTPEPTSLASHFIDKLKFNKEMLMDSIRGEIFETTYGNHKRYYIVDIILEPQKQRARDFLLLAQRHSVNKSFEEILEIFWMNEEQAEHMTVDQLLYEHKVGLLDFIGCLRKLDSKYGIQTDRSLPICFLQNPLTPTTFDFVNMDKTLHNYPSCRKHKVTVENFGFFPLLPAQHLRRYPLTISVLDQFMTIPSIMTQIERLVFANELRGRLKLIARTEDIFLATTSSSYDSIENNEVMEMVGDSVLKLIVSLFLYVRDPECSESDLTYLRTRYITNEYLMRLGMSNNIPYFLKIVKKNAPDWKLPYMKQQEKILKQFMTGKQVADCVEALIGATFFYNFNLLYPLLFMKEFGIPAYGYIMNTRLITDSSLAIPEEYVPPTSEDFHENLTYEELNRYFIEKPGFRHYTPHKKRYKVGEAYWKLNKMMAEKKINEEQYNDILVHSILHNFERNVLGYTFKKKSYLIQSILKDPHPTNPLLRRTLQSLEFLGDSIIEIYVLTNGYQMMKQLNKEMTPDLLQNLKVTVLSNSFMARIAVMNHVHKYLICNSIEIKEEVDRFSKSVDVNAPFKGFVKHQLQLPKILSDMLEALAAALLYDGGWPAVHKVYGRLIGPYIKFFCLYYHKIETNVVQKLKVRSLEENEIVEIITNVKDDIFETEVRKKGEFICKAQGHSAKFSKERACYEACKILGYID